MRPPGTGKKPPGGAGTHTGHTGHTGARGHTDHTDEPHNHPLKPNDPGAPGVKRHLAGGAGTPGISTVLYRFKNTGGDGTHTQTTNPTTTDPPPTQAHKSQPISDPQNGCSPERVDGFGSNHPHVHSLLHT